MKDLNRPQKTRGKKKKEFALTRGREQARLREKKEGEFPTADMLKHELIKKKKGGSAPTLNPLTKKRTVGLRKKIDKSKFPCGEKGSKETDQWKEGLES